MKLGERKTRILVAAAGFLNIYFMIAGHTYLGWSYDLCKLGIEIGTGLLAASYIVGRSASHFANKSNRKKNIDSLED